MMSNTEWTKQELVILEQLKNKEMAKAFGRCSAEEQAVFRKAGKENCLYFGGDSWAHPYVGSQFASATEYVIKPDFQPPEPEPEFVNCPVFQKESGLCFKYPLSNSYVANIFSAPGLLGFQGFFSKGTCTYVPGVANNWFQDGWSVYVRFKR